jgi:hypothetical protein
VQKVRSCLQNKRAKRAGDDLAHAWRACLAKHEALEFKPQYHQKEKKSLGEFVIISELKKRIGYNLS